MDELKAIFSNLRVIKDIQGEFIRDIEPKIRFFWNDDAVLSDDFSKLVSAI
jgi:hypothetical protein